MFESKTYREQRKASTNFVSDKKKKNDSDKKDVGKEDDQVDDKRRDKFSKESPRELKSKKYSDSRKERIKNEFVKSEKQSVLNKFMSSDRSKSLNHDIKPFTQLPQVKTDDLTKIIEGLEKKTKLEDTESKDSNGETFDKKTDYTLVIPKMRRSSLESGEVPAKEESGLKRQKSLDDRSKSSDREDSEEKEKSESTERRTERRIRNKVCNM